MQKKVLLSIAALCCFGGAKAQLNSNPDKFLGNITTSGQVDYGNEKFYTLWDQITCENESKWQSVEGTNDRFNWGCDNAKNYAQSHKFPFKFHALVWGSQYPTWLESMTPEQRYEEIVEWMDAVKVKYPNLELIDVVNEAIDGHQAGTKYFIEALGGKGDTGYDWIIKAFELAYERWPNAILIYNDFNTFQWNTDQYIDLVKTLRNAGAPVDAYGCQSHDLTDCSLTTFKNSMTKIQNALKMPMYSTEYDIGTSSDSQQKQRYSEQIPYMWEQDYVAGVTLWGYIYGKTWTTDGNSGIIKDGVDRPAMTWLREYMQSEKAKTAKSPFPGRVKEASVYVKPTSLSVEKGKKTSINVRAKMRTKTIEKVELYAKNALVATMTEAPYTAEYTPATTGAHELKAVVTCTDGETYTRYSSINVGTARTAFKTPLPEIPGTIECENFDKGTDGIAFHDTNTSKEGDAKSYRTDTGGIDVVVGGSGYAVGYTQSGEWMEYTVNVKEEGLYTYSIDYSSPTDGSKIRLSVRNEDGSLTPLTYSDIVLPTTGSWTTYGTASSNTCVPLKAGEQIIRVTIVSGEDTYVANLDRVTFEKYEVERAPYAGVINLPGSFEAENFDKGGDGISFHANDSHDDGNSCYRTDNQGVDIIKLTSDGYALSNMQAGEWVEYSVNVTQAGKYKFIAMNSSVTTGTKVSMGRVEEDGSVTHLWEITASNTGNLDTYKNVQCRTTKQLEEGPTTLRLSVTSGSCNIDNMQLLCTSPTDIQEVTSKSAITSGRYNLQGQRVGNDYRGITISNGKKRVRF